LCFWPSINRIVKSRMVRWGGHVARIGPNTYRRKLVGNTEGKRQLGKQRRRRVDNIKVDLR
jgi:hypothetical protein